MQVRSSLHLAPPILKAMTTDATRLLRVDDSRGTLKEVSFAMKNGAVVPLPGRVR